MSSSSNDFPTGISYLDNLQNIYSAAWPYPSGTDTTTGNSSANGIDAAYTAMTSTTTLFTPPINLKLIVEDFFKTFNNNTNPVPGNYADFLQKYSNYVNTVHPSIFGYLASGAGTEVDQGFQKSFAYSILERQGIDSDWAGVIIQGTPNLSTQFNNAWTAFVKTIQYGSDGRIATGFVGPDGSPIGSIPEAFFAAFSKFFSIEAKLQSATEVVVKTNYASASTVNVPSYEDVYNGFFGSTTEFSAFMQLFYQDTLVKTGNGTAANGYFIPSQNFGAFIDAVAKEVKSLGPSTVPSVTTDQSGRPAVINRIFRLLVLLITTLQGVAAAQANRLTLYTQWTKAYTDMMNQLPKFSGSDASSILRDNNFNRPNDSAWQSWNSLVPLTDKNPGNLAHRLVTTEPDHVASKADRATARQNLNDNVVAPMTERMRANRDSVTNDSKALQSVVNQSNDAVSQQTNMATALLQTLSTLLGSIFR